MANASYSGAFVQAIKSGAITLLVGDEGESVDVPKALVTKTSGYLGKLIEEHGGTLNFREEPTEAVKTFISWCYQGRLQPVDPKTSGIERKTMKRNFIELWMFSANFEIPKLQNEAMQALLTIVTVPHLVTKKDVKNVWMNSFGTDKALKWFIVYALVAQIEEGTGNTKAKIEDLEEFMAAPGFAVMLYKALQQWSVCPFPKTPKKGATEWTVFAGSDGVTKNVMVKERVVVHVEETVAVKETQMPVRVKREAPEDGEEDGSRSKKAKGFTNGELIVLDDD